MSKTSRILAAGLCALAAWPALAVGLGPLTRSGLADGPDKGFWLTLINSDPQVRTFKLSALDAEWQPVGAVEFMPAAPVLGPGRQRRVLVLIRGLQPGETRTVRACAENLLQEGPVHARVCSKLVVRRVSGAAGRAAGSL